MKKLFISSLFILLLNTSVMAWEPIPFSVYYDDEQPIIHGHGRNTIQAPTVYIEDYMLTFEAYHPDYTLIIKDEDGDVVFSTVVWSAQTEVVLPSSLSGDYEIELVMGNWLFSGWINL